MVQFREFSTIQQNTKQCVRSVNLRMTFLCRQPTQKFDEFLPWNLKSDWSNQTIKGPFYINDPT